MQLNDSTDYAIRIILYLAKEKKTVPSSKLSAAIGVSSRYLLKIGAKLRDAGFIITSYGSAGGYVLSKSACDISLHDIIIVMEGRIKAKQCINSEDSAEFQILDTAYDYVDSVIGDILKSITIKNLLSQNINEWYLATSLLNLPNKMKEQP